MLSLYLLHILFIKFIKAISSSFELRGLLYVTHIYNLVLIPVIHNKTYYQTCLLLLFPYIRTYFLCIKLILNNPLLTNFFETYYIVEYSILNL